MPGDREAGGLLGHELSEPEEEGGVGEVEGVGLALALEVGLDGGKRGAQGLGNVGGIDAFEQG